MSTLEQYLRDHGFDAEDAAVYAAHTERWMRSHATLQLSTGHEDEAAIIENTAYLTRDRDT